MQNVNEALAHRFGAPLPGVRQDLQSQPFWQQLASRRSIRSFRPDPVDAALIQTLCALALSSPTKSDLQQRDIIIISDSGVRGRLNELLAGQAWVAKAPAFLVFCGNNHRQRLLHDWRGRAFENDHLDAFFNASVDAGIALATFVLAAEAAGLGCCPVSAIRNEAAEVSALLNLPDFVFPIAGLALGWPSEDGEISLRLPLSVSVHTDRYEASNLREAVATYDQRRASIQPYEKQRFASDYGESEAYGWSEDKARQYSKPERENFGAFVRAKGVNLD